MNLFRLGSFSAHSGQQLAWKIECDALTSEDLGTVAWLLAQRLPKFGDVEGVPLGGERLATQLRPFRTRGPLLIVDDVLTTGTSMENFRAGRDAIGAVIFARDVCPVWVLPLFQLVGTP